MLLYDEASGLKKTINHAHSRPGMTKIHSFGRSLRNKGKQIPGATLGVHTDSHCPQPPSVEPVPQLRGASLLLGKTELQILDIHTSSPAKRGGASSK